MENTPNVTQLLQDLRRGRQDRFGELLEIVYADLRNLAQWHLQKERSNHTLNATALVHESYLRLMNYHDVDWNDRAHFFAIAAQAMRRVLANYARDRQAQKRGGKQVQVTLQEDVLQTLGADTGELVLLDETLKRLEAVNERACRIVECRFFGGLTVEETAEALSVSSATVARDWRMARAWLKRAFKQESGG